MVLILKHIILTALLLCVVTPVSSQVKYVTDYNEAYLSKLSPTFRFDHVNSNKSLDPYNQGNDDSTRATTVWPYNANDDAFRWVVVPFNQNPSQPQFGEPISINDLRIGDGVWYYIVNARNGLVLTVNEGGIGVSNWGMWERNYKNRDRQLWRFDEGPARQGQGNPYASGEYISIINKQTGKFLVQRSGGTKAKETSVHVWPRHGVAKDPNATGQWKVMADKPMHLYKLTIEKILCIHPSTGQDKWTSVLFSGIDLAIEAGQAAATGGASTVGSAAKVAAKQAGGYLTATGIRAGARAVGAVSRQQIVNAARQAVKDAARDKVTGTIQDGVVGYVAPTPVQDALAVTDLLSISSQDVFNKVYGESPDDLDLRVNGISIWPYGGRTHISTKSQRPHLPRTLEYIFRASSPISIQLVENDIGGPFGSDDDSLGSLTWQPYGKDLRAPVRFENMLISKPSEGSLYELTFTIEPLTQPALDRPGITITTPTDSTANGVAVTFTEGMDIPVQWNAFGRGVGLLTLAQAGAPAMDYFQGEYVRSANGKYTFSTSGGLRLPPGDYEIRLYDQKEGTILAAKQPFRVISGATVNTDITQYSGDAIRVDWSGLASGDGLLTVARADASKVLDVRNYLRADPVKGSAGSHVFSADYYALAPGHYEVRIYDRQGNGALAGTQLFTVLAAESKPAMAANQPQPQSQQAAQSSIPAYSPVTGSAVTGNQATGYQQTPQIQKLSSTAGEIRTPEQNYYPTVEQWGFNGQTTRLKFAIQGQPFQIDLREGASNTQASGNLTPCDEGICTCALNADEQTGRVWGTCSSSAQPDQVIHFSSQRGSVAAVQSRPAVVPPSRPATAPSRPVAAPSRPAVAAHSPAIVKLATGTGSIRAADQTFKPVFEFWGSNGQSSMIKFAIDGQAFQIAENSNLGDGVVYLTPCEGGTCICNLTPDEQNGRVQGSCSNSAYPENGTIQISIQIDGAAASRQQATRPQAARQNVSNQRVTQQQPVQRPVVQQNTGQQLQKMASGRGEINQMDEIIQANFEFWGDGDQATSIKFGAKGLAFQIAVNNSGSNDQASGRLTPCDGGICNCVLNSDEGQSLVTGACTNSSYPEYGEMTFRIHLN